VTQKGSSEVMAAPTPRFLVIETQAQSLAATRWSVRKKPRNR